MGAISATAGFDYFLASGNYGYDFVGQDNDPRDDNVHGTHVAGLAGAVGKNSIGVSGVMPRGVRLVAVQRSRDFQSASMLPATTRRI